jgi:hypothetical protein
MAPLDRDSSPSSTLAERQEPTLPREPTTPAAATSIPVAPGAPPSNEDEKTRRSSSDGGVVDVGKEMDEKIREGEYEPVAKVELDENGVQRKIVLVVEEKTGKEVAKDVTGGPYTIPQW